MKHRTSFARPTVIVSNCLCEAPCRWDGDRLSYPFVRALRKYARVIAVCPEVKIGLGVPRDRIILVKRPSGVALLQPSSGQHFARKMNNFARKFLESHSSADGFILKHKSPSCGPRQVKLYESGAPNATFVRQGTGLFAAQVLAHFPQAAIEDEERLEIDRFREHWLTKLFALASFRAVRESNSPSGLPSYHAYYQSLLMTLNKRLARELDRILLQTGKVSDSCAAIEQYEAVLHRTLAKPARRRSIVKPFELALEHYGQSLNGNERKRFRRLCDHYLTGHKPLAELRKAVQIWAVRYDKTYTRERAVFRPYPGPLADA